jgi:predicted helicase
MRKKRGVYYTPEPVVKFIVRGVDYLLKSEFDLSMGLADTSMIEHTFLEQGKKIKKNIHRVQVLDPAT